MARRQQRLTNDAAVRGHCQEWQRLIPMNCELADAEVPKVDAEVGELFDIRSQIVTAKKAMAELANAPAASAELKAMVRDYVERMASRHTPRIRVAGGGMYIDWQSVDVLGVPEAPFGVLCWAAPKMVTERLTADVLELCGYAAGVTESERARRSVELESRLLDLERTEEAIVEALLASGVDCQRRFDASPQAILQVTVNRSAAAA
jgi:hypothetical protein